MFDHVTIGPSDREASRRFYATVLPVIGCEPTSDDDGNLEWGDFSLALTDDGRPVTTGLHIGFAAASHAHVDAFWQTGVDAGYASDGEPGPRPQYSDAYYGAFLLDPDGNSVEAVVHGDLRGAGEIDHLWIRVRDRDASRAWYAAIAEPAGFRPVADVDRRTRFSRGPGQGSFSILEDDRPVTTPFHVAFSAPDRATVDAFHAAGLAAGHTDHGAPGERPQYHPGYYGAFLLDPDGHNVEAVFHDR